MLQKAIQSFVDHVCEGEGWRKSIVNIPSWEDWHHIAIQASDGRFPPEKIYGCSCSSGRIYINPRRISRVKGRTIVLHELCHQNMPIEELLEILNDPILKKKPDLRIFSIESRMESKAKKLSRKYRDEWNQLVKTSHPDNGE